MFQSDVPSATLTLTEMSIRLEQVNGAKGLQMRIGLSRVMSSLVKEQII